MSERNTWVSAGARNVGVRWSASLERASAGARNVISQWVSKLSDHLDKRKHAPAESVTGGPNPGASHCTFSAACRMKRPRAGLRCDVDQPGSTFPRGPGANVNNEFAHMGLPGASANSGALRSWSGGSGEEESGDMEEHWSCETDRIHTIQHASMSIDHYSPVLRSEAPLDR